MDLEESRDQATLRTLRQIDPDLAGLFKLGRELCRQPDRPGLAYLIAHAGRELTNCLIAQLEEGVADKTEVLETDAHSEEDRRYRLANALGLSPNHDTVRRWFRVHQVFARAAHARVPGPKLGPLRPAFAELADLLFGRVGEYFHTQDEIDALADSPNPSDVDPEQLRRRLLRPIQRHRFFSRIQRREWMQPLTRAGFFRNPPRRQTLGDGSWRARPWPEGGYLVRMASVDPAGVLDVLAAIPDDHDNPNVWFTVIDAIKALPDVEAGTLAVKFTRALRNSSAVSGYHAVEAAASLATRGRLEAFQLVDALLWLGTPPSIPERGGADTPQEYMKVLTERRWQVSWSDTWLLTRLDDFAFEALLDRVIPPLRALDAGRTLELLAARADRASTLVPRAEHLLADASSRVAQEADIPVDDVGAGTGDGLNIRSRYWCEDLSHDDHRRSVRARLVIETFRTAKHLIGSGAQVRDVVDRLAQHSNEVFTRMVYALLADASALDDSLKVRVENFVASEDAIWPDFGARETAALLRAHFTAVSQEAQQAFLDNLERGPGDEYVTGVLRFSERQDSPQARDEAIAAWQRQRLRWFHDSIPPLLQPLAARLGVVPAKPTARQQDLDEVGSWSSGVTTGRSRGPVPWQELAAMTGEDFATYLSTWQPPVATGDPWESPSLEGLRNEINALASNAPHALDAFRPEIVAARIPLHFVTAMLQGLRSAVQDKKPVALALVLALSRHAWTRAEQVATTTKADRQAAEWAGDAVSDLLTQYIETVTLDPRSRGELWSALGDLAGSSFLWQDDPETVLPSTYAQARHASFACTSARLTRALFALAWVEFMSDHADAKWPPPARTRAAENVLPILESMLSRQGANAVAAQGVFGQHLGQLLWFAHEWTIGALSRLLDGGSESPGSHPAWCVYVDTSRLVPEIFGLLRNWYAHHAAFLPPDASPPEQDPDSQLAGDFAVHVILACATGACAPGDPDGLVENTFTRSPLAARTHAYWVIFRSWSDAKRPLRKYSRNVIAFWESRLRALEAAGPSEARDEELDALCWFIATPRLPTAEVIRLGQRTTTLLGRKHRVTGLAWDRLRRLAARDPAGTFVIVEQLVDRILRGDYPYLSFGDVAPLLRLALRAGGPLREQALALLHRIGEAGFSEFDALWRQAKSVD